MTLPTPEAGLVIHYSYLWAEEQRAGRDEGAKDRPCVVILAVEKEQDETIVLVVPITHSLPGDVETALEIPGTVKRFLGLDGERSWIILTESNVFDWPGPDLRKIRGGSVAYGLLPPRFFAELKRRFIGEQRRLSPRQVHRTS